MKLGSLLLTLVLFAPNISWAHVQLLYPQARYGRGELKDGPCGRIGGERTTNVSRFRPGSTITVRFDEYIDHPGHFRIAFDPDGADVFQDPPCVGNCENGNMQIAVQNAPWILLDGIPDRVATQGDSIYSVDVTLPNITCDNCTLQVIQVMTDKAPYTLPGNDLYYQCADLVLANDDSANPDAGAGDPTPTPDAGSDSPPSQSPTDPTPTPDAGSDSPPSQSPTDPTPTSGGCQSSATNNFSLFILLALTWIGLKLIRNPRRIL